MALEVYRITGSTFAVGQLGLWALVPVVVLGLYGGALADAYDRRRVALVASAVMWVATLGIVAQAYLDLNNVMILYVLAAIQAGASSVNFPARSAIIPRLVGPELLPAANALNMITMTVAMMAGPMAGAVLVATIGYGPTYTIDAITFTFALYAIFRLPPMPPLQSGPGETAGSGQATTAPGQAQAAAGDALTPARGWRSVAQGLRYLSTRSNVRMTFLSDMSAMILAFPRTVFPAVGAVLIGGGTTVAGALTTCIALGSTLASVLSGPLGRVRRQGRAVVWSVAAWGLSVTVFGGVLVAVGRTSPSRPIVWALVIAGLALICAGAADSISAIFRGTILQTATPDALRGRLQGVFTVVVTGGPRLGDLVSGTDSAWLGESWAMLAGGTACIVSVILLALWHPGFLRYDARHPVA